jgi:predicted DNA-binding transcriptional regulator AlpA
MRQSKWLKLSEVLEQIGVSRSTFDMWRVDGNAPRTYVLPSGQLRFKQIDVDEWLESRVEYNGKGAA